jgi:hypothetical protein
MVRSWCLGSLAFLLSGCATLFSGTSQDVTFTSDPDGADVVLDGDVIGKTPLTYELDRQTFRRSEVVIRKDGFRSEQFPVKKTLNTVALFNCTSVLSWGTDALTGAMMEYSPSKYFVELKPRHGAADVSHRFALQFVLLTHASLRRALARHSGEELRVLAGLFGVTESEYPRFLDVLTEASPALVGYAYPHELFRALSQTLAREGWTPVDTGCTRFDNSTEIALDTPQGGGADHAFLELVRGALGGALLAQVTPPNPTGVAKRVSSF